MAQPALTEEDIYGTDLPVGEILRRARVHYGQSLEDVERNIRIRASQIDAIEKGDFEKIPGRVYAVGFIRSYAEYLGLDGEKMVRLFKAQYGGGRMMKTELNFPEASEDVRMAPAWVMILSIFIVLALIGLWWGTRDNDRSAIETVPPVENIAPEGPPATQTQIPPAPEEAYGPPGPEAYAVASGQDTPQDSSNPVTEAAAPVTAQPAVPAEEPKKTTILNIVQNSWVEIKDKDGKTLVSRVLSAGDRYYVPDNSDLLMSLGNSGGVEIIVDGQKLRPLGGVGEVKRNVSLDATSLKKNYGTAR